MSHLTKCCSVCNVVKPLDQFWRDKNKPDGFTTACKLCANARRNQTKKLNPGRQAEYSKRYREKNPNSHRNGYLLRTYGITEEKYMQLVAEQDGKCAICSRDPDGNLHVDHDHSCCSGGKTCGKCIRGLLCGDCNRGLGLFQDNPDLLTLASDYLRQLRSIAPGTYQDFPKEPFQ